jgi:hypothetical protein
MQCVKAWILSIILVVCVQLFLPHSVSITVPRAAKGKVKAQAVWFCIFIRFRLFYSPEIIPRSLVFYLDNAHYCVCGSACFEVFTRRCVPLQLKCVTNTLTLSENVDTTVPTETFYCSSKCVNLRWKLFNSGNLFHMTTLRNVLIHVFIDSSELVYIEMSEFVIYVYYCIYSL